MKIQAVNFKTPIIKSSVSFGYGSNAGKSGVDSNISGYGHISDISRAERDSFVCKSSKIDPKKEFKGRQIQADSLNVLSWANAKQKEAKRKYAEAKKIYRTWQEERPQVLVEDGKTKEYLVSYGSLNMYFETDFDGSKKMIKYLYDKPVDITEIDPNGKRDVYSFSDSGNLQRLIEGKYEKTTKKGSRDITESIYTFSPDGYLSTCKQNQQEINGFNRSGVLKSRYTTIDTIMNFDVVGKKPYLKEAKSGIQILSNGTVFDVESSFKYDENGKLIEAR